VNDSLVYPAANHVEVMAVLGQPCDGIVQVRLARGMGVGTLGQAWGSRGQCVRALACFAALSFDSPAVAQVWLTHSRN
jgi:hypothetical protein